LHGRGRVRLLLASSSVAALLIGGGAPSAFAACGPTLTGSVSGCTNSGTTPGIVITNATVSGNISNTGSITATGISVTNHSTINGAILSSGTIETSSPSASGISIDATSQVVTSEFSSTLTAVRVNGSTFIGGITNSGTISGQLGGVLVGGNSSASSIVIATFGGGISNSGLIALTGPSGNGIVVGGNVHSGANITVSNFSGNISNSGTISAGNNGIVVGGGAGGEAGSELLAISLFTGNITNSGSIFAGNNGIVIGGSIRFASGTAAVTVSTFAGGIVNSGSISAGGVGILVGGIASFGAVSVSTFSSGIVNTSGGIITARTGIAVGGFAAGIGSVTVSNFAGGITNNGKIIASNYGILVGSNPTGSSSVVISTFSGGITNTGTISAKTGVFVGSSVQTFSGAIANSGTISGSGGPAIDVSGANNAITINQQGGLISGDIKLSAYADQLNITGGVIAGNIVGQGGATITLALGAGNTFTYGAAYGFSGISQVNINSGTVVFNGVNSAENVDVFGGTLAGTGTLDPLVVTIHSGATFAPGTPGSPGTMTIIGNLAFQSGALYLVQVTPGQASSANVSGTASVASNVNVNAVFASGAYVQKQYDILHAGGVTGTFAALNTVDLPAGFTASLVYTPTDVYLDLASNIGQVPTNNLNINQQNVANALNNYFNSGGALPPNFVPVYGLTGANLADALTRLSGEAATGAAQGAFLLMDQFLELMLDPFVDGRGGGNFQAGGGAAYGFAPEQQASFPPDVALAYDAVLKAPPAAAFDRRWTTWGAAFGGSNTTAGDAAVGSHDSTAQIYGYAAGMDYHYARDSVVGFALSGGGTNWALSQGVGGGRSDAFQAGLYSTTHWGAAYVAAALDASNYWMSTSRGALAGDQLNANFMAQGYGVRAEAGYRFATPLPGTPFLGVTPYGALRALSFHSPSYSEADPSSGGFGLSYNATTATDTRGELGARFDDPTIVAGMPLVLRGRLAWAHDWASDPAINATFETLPGAGFTVNGARIPQDSALVSGGAQLFVTSRWSLLARVEGQFADGSQTYTGSGTLRYSW